MLLPFQRLRFLLVTVLFTAVLLTPSVADEPAAEAPDGREAALLSGVRQLTFAGRRAGEGYFSRDGREMVFQSERLSDNPFFQIYVMDRETGDLEQISPGFGKTTCAWIHPEGSEILFASTHADPQSKQLQKDELEARATGKEKRYSWDYDSHYELYVYDRKSKTNKQITNAEGYDAEGSWSPDGKWIAFASNRHAYTAELTAKEKEIFERDKSYFNEIYIMRHDGSQLKRLTTEPGYDGGPFFSPDGKRLCWRRFTPDGALAEIMTMNVDGSDVRQMTRMGAMSWAPYYHPSGKYLIYTTNAHGFANFELYIVAVDGKSPPVRVTTTEGFDGLPVFTPDGKQLSWTTNRNAKKQSQIFIADWNHDTALELLGAENSASDVAANSKLPLREAPATAANTDAATSAAKAAAGAAAADYRARDLMRHVDYLCRRELEGRLTGSAGERMATAYVAAYFDHLGLKPGGDDGGWYQEFEFTAGISLDEGNRLASSVGDQDESDHQVDTEWRPLAFSAIGKVPAAPVAFAGYGIAAPKRKVGDTTQAEYDSFVHLDVKDKWVLCFRFLPDDVTPERRQHLARFSSLRFKAMQARERGARGLIVVSGPNSKVKQQLVRLRFDGSMGDSGLPVISISDAVAKKWMASSDKDLGQLQSKLDSGEPMMGFELKDLQVSASIALETEKKSGRNVLGILSAEVEPTKQSIVVGAHIDHLGRGTGGSLAKGDEVNQIHFGADDNASGVAGLLEIAEYLSDLKRKGKFPARRDVIFAAWSGEELGLLGASHFTATYPIPAAHGHAHAHGAHAGAHAGAHGGVDPHADPHAANPHGKPAKDPHSAKPIDPHAAKPTDPHAAKSDDPHAAKSDDPHPVDPHSKNPHAAPKSKDPHAAPNSKDPHAAAAHAHAAAPGSLYPHIAACLNMDMIGRFEKRLVLQGAGSSSIWDSEIEQRNAPVGLPITVQDDCYLPTDASAFFMRGVPILAAFTGSHSEYHTPRDTPDRLNYDSAAKIARLMGLVTRSLAIADEAPDFVNQERPDEDRPRAGLRAYLGTIPDYAQTDIKGVLLSGVAKQGPAAKAGVKGGDVIVELAGRKVANIYDYTYAIDALKIGEKVKIVVKRGERRVPLDLVPASRN